MGLKLIRIGKWQPIRMRFNWWKTLLLILVLFGGIFLLEEKCTWISSDIKPTIGKIIQFAICAIIMTSINRMLPRRQGRVATILSFAMSLLFMIYGVVSLFKGETDQAVLSFVIFGVVFMLGIYCAWRWRRHYLHVRERQFSMQMAAKRRIRREKML